MAFKDQINQNVGFFIYNREFLFFSGIIGSPQAFNRFQIIPVCKAFYWINLSYESSLKVAYKLPYDKAISKYRVRRDNFHTQSM